MSAIQQLLTAHIDIWTAAETEKKTGRGRANGNAASVYGIKKLRELILELAVRGKLVPQDASDEPTSELLKRIQTEKAKLFSEGKLKNDKPVVAINNQEKSFSLPATWEYVRFSVVANTRLGKMLDQVKNKGIYRPYLRNTNVQWSAFDLDDLKEMRFEEHELDEYRVIAGDLVICEGGEPGRCAIWEGQIEEMFIQKALHRARPWTGISSNFLQFCFSVDASNGRLNQFFTGATIKHFSGDKLSGYPIPLPPTSEQHRIVAKVDELMALCDQLEDQHSNAVVAHEQLVSHLLDTLKQSQSETDFNTNWQRIAAHFDTLFTTEASIDALKQTLLQLGVMGKLVAQDANDEPASELLKRIQTEKAKLIAEGKIKKDKPSEKIAEKEIRFAIPSTWEWVRMADLCRPISSGSTPSAELFQYGEGVPFIKVYNIRNQEIDFDYRKQFISESLNSAKLSRSILFPGDVVMNIVGPPLGKVAIIPDTYPQWNCNQAIVFFGLIPPMCIEYVLNYLKEGSFLQDIELIGTAGQDNISVTKSKNILVPVPPLTEQHRIAAKVDELMILCDQLRSRLTGASQMQKKLADVLVECAVME